MVCESILIINKRGKMRLLKRVGTIGTDEIALRLKVNLDPVVFRTFMPTAQVEVDASMNILPVSVGMGNMVTRSNSQD